MATTASTSDHHVCTDINDSGRIANNPFLQSFKLTELRQILEKSWTMTRNSRFTSSTVYPIRDLILNSFLVWLIPSNSFCHLLKFGIVLTVSSIAWIVGLVLLLWNHQYGQVKAGFVKYLICDTCMGRRRNPGTRGSIHTLPMD